jgi:hypothetical protein
MVTAYSLPQETEELGGFGGVGWPRGQDFVSGQFARRLSADFSMCVFMILKFSLWFGFKTAPVVKTAT